MRTSLSKRLFPHWSRGIESVTTGSWLLVASPMTTNGADTTSSSLSRLSRRTFHSTPKVDTTIVCVRKNGQVCLMGDGMVSQGSMIIKPNVAKIRRIPPKTNVSSSTPTSDSNGNGEDGDKEDKPPGGTVIGFAGSTADAFTLLERLEGKLDEYPGQLARSCVELAKGWRMDKYLRRLEASLVVADATISLEITGNGDVLESHDGILGVGSGSPYAIAAARALIDIEELSAEEVARKAMIIAANMDLATNDNFMVEVLDANAPPEKEEEGDVDKK